MSIFAAMFAGVSGLNAQSQSLGIISDNIANLNTVGYKVTRTDFSTLVTQQATLTSFSPGGVLSRPSQLIDQQGLLQSSSSDTDIALSGDGFFIVNTQSASSNSQFFFTRAGSFETDINGNLVNTAGFFLQGWPTDSTGTPTVGNLSILDNLQTVNVTGVSGTAKATSSIEIGANLPASATVGSSFDNNVLIFDSLGVAHNLKLTWTKTATNTWDLAIADPTLASDSSVTTGTSAPATVLSAVTFNGDGTPNTISIPTISITGWTTGASDSTISLDVGTANQADGLTQFSGNFSTSFINQDGVQFGVFSGVNISENGLVTAIFDNGQTRPIFQIPVATFTNANGLTARTGNIYQQTDRSGQPLLNFAGSGGAAKISPSSLEASTVDLAEEFTRMIVTQRAFSANSRIITTADEMLDELVRIKR